MAPLQEEASREEEIFRGAGVHLKQPFPPSAVPLHGAGRRMDLMDYWSLRTL